MPVDGSVDVVSHCKRCFRDALEESRQLGYETSDLGSDVEVVESDMEPVIKAAGGPSTAGVARPVAGTAMRIVVEAFPTRSLHTLEGIPRNLTSDELKLLVMSCVPAPLSWAQLLDHGRPVRGGRTLSERWPTMLAKVFIEVGAVAGGGRSRSPKRSDDDAWTMMDRADMILQIWRRVIQLVFDRHRIADRLHKTAMSINRIPRISIVGIQCPSLELQLLSMPRL